MTVSPDVGSLVLVCSESTKLQKPSVSERKYKALFYCASFYSVGSVLCTLCTQLFNHVIGREKKHSTFWVACGADVGFPDVRKT